MFFKVTYNYSRRPESRGLDVTVCCVNVGPQARARARSRVERPAVIRFTATNHSNYFRPGQLQLTGRETSIMHPRIADHVTNRVTLRFARLARSLSEKEKVAHLGAMLLPIFAAYRDICSADI